MLKNLLTIINWIFLGIFICLLLVFLFPIYYSELISDKIFGEPEMNKFGK